MKEGFIKPITINRATSFPDLETALQEIQSRGGAGRDLLLASNWNVDSRPGGSAAAAQLLVTWCRSNNKHKIIAHITRRADERALDGFNDRMHGLIATAMADEIVTRDGASQIQDELYKRAYRRLQLNEGLPYNFGRGSELALLCIDHWPEFAYPKQLYEVTPDSITVKNQAEFESLMGQFSSHLGDLAAKLITGLSDLSQLVFELFSNTDRHALTNEAGEMYPRSVRGIIFALRRVPISSLSEFSTGLRGLRLYLDELQPFVKGGLLYLAEVSVFDSGPGYVRRMCPTTVLDEISSAREREIVRGCFLKNITSSNAFGRGKGLTRVLQVLKDRGGFLRIRTGRLSLYQNFPPSSPTRLERIHDSDLRLRDIDTLEEIPNLRARTEGTSVSMLVPVGLRLP